MSNKKNESFQEEKLDEEIKASMDEIDEATSVEEPEKDEQETAPVDELTEAKAAFSDMEDRYLRIQAEMANMRKRNQKEREDAAKYRSQDIAKELLPVIDNLERAMAIEVSDEQGESLKKGLEMVMNTFRTALKSEGIEEINPVGESFDPNFHQAVQTVPAEDGQAADTVVNVLQKGYILKDRVLRPAMVIVSQ
ncbi:MULTISPECIES: nucleotide exchange factor GrpE [Carnobacterium]|uniref:Protein GrpE n=1 Tax=Carnobacterium divergens TaxID=2748 RepID=A0A5F0MBG9_CARDV|nr:MULTISPECIES: nucleotide exchange factor GrpE [Carnobacterium]MDT1938740.1 nucleotide exchange factor GrpE [Carnobacterium divergens]MDT1941178.1 nucleotide exchange factor GrpE [Carnobacterium divergens]MDT1946976.1 nucleotide exchange factor GrpE [Carnobacterium divergens]MDT1949413.1 nucleotide exchange factor GrpE [Carnobacterium divergens]MDT1954591.1 nucleotide exchange factor GrpE [Carnobacterium divergens]